jgi:hypothetical protein
MDLQTSFTATCLTAVLISAVPVSSLAATQPSQFIRALDTMMAALGPDSSRASATIRRVYQDHLDLLMLDGYTDLEGALDNGGLVPLPENPMRFNISPRLEGPHPIGEKDLDNQVSYVSARPATIGVLLEIASRVKSGPVEITSLVRHSHYQDALKTTNANANTSVPMHTMGLAFDIGLVNSRQKTITEIRNVLTEMQRDGDILFIGERRQLVFHVVPHPSRLGHFTDVYIKEVGLPPTSRSAHVVAAAPSAPRRKAQRIQPRVQTEVLAVLPAYGPVDVLADEAAPSSASVAPIDANAVNPARTIEKAASSARVIFQRWFILLAGLLAISWRLAARPRVRASLFESRA